MIDLNSSIYDQIVTKKEVLDSFSEYYIFSNYLGYTPVLDKSYNSPLRTNDIIPSFRIFKHRGVLLFKDFGGTGESGDCFKLVKLLYSLDSYQEAIRYVYKDLSENRIKSIPNILTTDLKDKQYKVIKIKVRSWTRNDLKFWKQFGISILTLKAYRVVPISHMFIDDYTIKADSYAYAFIEEKDGIMTFKIYQPYSSLYKWINNQDYSVHQGYSQLPKTGELLVITKSRKDIMSIKEVTNCDSIGIQAETVLIKPHIMWEYKNRFKKIVTLFDNDSQGISSAIKYRNWYGIPMILIPKRIAKDFSDSVKILGIYDSKLMFNSLINCL